jgi:hypothetical protein
MTVLMMVVCAVAERVIPHLIYAGMAFDLCLFVILGVFGGK